MNWAYLHLVINHFPIIGVIIGMLITGTGYFIKNQTVTLTGLATLLFAALASVFAFLTGDPAEDLLKSMPEIPASLISRHEDIASVAMYLILPTGILSALGLYNAIKKEKTNRIIILLTVVFSVLASAAMVYAGRTGGQIRHSEFRSPTINQYIIDHKNDVEED